MPSQVNELLEALRRDRQLSAWSRSRSLRDVSEKLLEEVKEVQEVIASGTFQFLSEEMGDVLWTLLFLAVVAEESELLSIDGMVSQALQKLHKRKPWLTSNAEFSLDEEARMWREAKQKEKAEG